MRSVSSPSSQAKLRIVGFYTLARANYPAWNACIASNRRRVRHLVRRSATSACDRHHLDVAQSTVGHPGRYISHWRPYRSRYIRSSLMPVRLNLTVPVGSVCAVLRCLPHSCSASRITLADRRASTVQVGRMTEEVELSPAALALRMPHSGSFLNPGCLRLPLTSWAAPELLCNPPF